MVSTLGLLMLKMERSEMSAGSFMISVRTYCWVIIGVDAIGQKRAVYDVNLMAILPFALEYSRVLIKIP